MTKKLLSKIVLLSLLLISSLSSVNFEVADANPYRRDFKFTEVPPPAGTQPPVIIIHTPRNGSFYPNNLDLTFDVIIPETNGDKPISAVTKLYYRASWKPNEIVITEKGFGESTSFSINLSDVHGGNNSLTIYAVGYGSYKVSEEFIDSATVIYYYEKFEMTGYSTVSLIKDLVPSWITVLSPQNTTYDNSAVKLDFTVNEAVSQILYSLDGKENQTITGNTTLTGLANGDHSLTLYLADLAGNAVSSKTLFFNVNLPEPFPIVSVAISSIISSIVLGAGLLVYFKKRRMRGL